MTTSLNSFILFYVFFCCFFLLLLFFFIQENEVGLVYVLEKIKLSATVQKVVKLKNVLSEYFILTNNYSPTYHNLYTTAIAISAQTYNYSQVNLRTDICKEHFALAHES